MIQGVQRKYRNVNWLITYLPDIIDRERNRDE